MKPGTFLLRLLLFSLPLLSLLVFYFWQDPFKVIHHYDSYIDSGKPYYIGLNRDYVSTENWVNHYPEYKYDSYIFGNSRSLFYRMESWKNFIGEPASKCYHFDASGETLYGLEIKLRFLAGQNAGIRHSLILLDFYTLQHITNSEGHLFIKDPRTSGQSRLAFQAAFLKSFFSFNFFRTFFDLKLSGRIKPYMEDSIIDGRIFAYDKISNEMTMPLLENLIQTDPVRYYEAHRALFYPRKPELQVSDCVIGPGQIKLLESIRNMLKADSSDYRIVVNPLYDQLKLNPADLRQLKNIFGNGNVFDLSGINWFTEDIHHYYETSHYRPYVADSIMALVYSEGNQLR
jgi:hypothetical protein